VVSSVGASDSVSVSAPLDFRPSSSGLQGSGPKQFKRIGSPNRTPAIDLRPRFYAVLEAEDLGVDYK
jgi:hypothetical protein